MTHSPSGMSSSTAWSRFATASASASPRAAEDTDCPRISAIDRACSARRSRSPGRSPRKCAISRWRGERGTEAWQSAAPRVKRDAIPATLNAPDRSSPLAARAKHGSAPGLAATPRSTTRSASTPNEATASASASATRFANARGPSPHGPGRLAASANVSSPSWSTASPPVGRRTVSRPDWCIASRSQPSGNGSARPRLMAGGFQSYVRKTARSEPRETHSRRTASILIWTEPVSSTCGSRRSWIMPLPLRSEPEGAQPVVEQEHHAADQERDARHHRIAVRRAEADHEEIDPEPRRSSQSAFVLLREEEEDQRAHETHDEEEVPDACADAPRHPERQDGAVDLLHEVSLAESRDAERGIDAEHERDRPPQEPVP